ncbi:hypothetical protein CERSUDRAFT_158761 [Gelatoporia subvermispora B]|uniref:Cerato-platanin n=1 Tax=Ceriporiopsis subvermispora (strain B) TaxID=914234 RepID=M2QBG8_CERS8|nr:hypothetical protein CERSUDRAFT_158761 [Gelatoporia subvermispora B]
MQFKWSVLTALALSAGAFAQSSSQVSVSFDQTYDDADNSLDIVACSHVLEAGTGFTTFGSLSGAFPNIGGAGVVEEFDDPNCGTCWNLTFHTTSVQIFVIDHSAEGTFNIALEAMNTLTDGQAEFLGRVNATAVQIPVSDCNIEF